MKHNEFDSEVKYKLFRNIKEILHPTISKKNISDYKIIIDEDILPVRIFYPKKVTNLEKVIIYIHGNGDVTECTGKYSDICKLFTAKTDSLLIAIEYEEIKDNYKKMYQEIYDTVKYIYKGLERNNINPNNIVLIGDSTGCNIITGINYLNNNDFNISKEILLYPTLSLEYYGNTSYESINKNNEFNFNLLNRLKKYYDYISIKPDDLLLTPLKREDYSNTPNTLIITGNVDSLKDEAIDYYNRLSNKNNKYLELEFLSHGFLKRLDKDVEKEIFSEVNNFIK